MKSLKQFILFSASITAIGIYITLTDNPTTLRERLLKTKTQSRELNQSLTRCQENNASTLAALESEIAQKHNLQTDFDAYKAQFRIVDYQWMTNEVQTCHLGLKDGQQSTNMGRWPVEWNARQGIWMQVDKE